MAKASRVGDLGNNRVQRFVYAGTPDGRIRLGKGTYVGDNVYTLTAAGQAKTGSKAPGKTVKFGILVQNDSASTADSFKLLATGLASAMYTVTYFKGTTNITAAVVAGTYTTSSLAPGATVLIRVKVKINSSATPGSSTTRLFIITSVADGTLARRGEVHGAAPLSRGIRAACSAVRGSHRASG